MASFYYYLKGMLYDNYLLLRNPLTLTLTVGVAHLISHCVVHPRSFVCAKCYLFVCFVHSCLLFPLTFIDR